MAPRTWTLAEVVRTLRRMYGVPTSAPIDDPLQWILWENCAYLVDDTRRQQTYDSLARSVGTSPAQLLAATPAKLERAIAAGGMHPARRVAKLRTIAQEALDRFDGDLAALVAGPTAAALRGLQRFPGIGLPGAEKILLFARRLPVLAVESNGLRVLLRLGFGREQRSYAASYQSVRAAIVSECRENYDWLIAAHWLLRLHGQVTCRRGGPDCASCQLAERCTFSAAHR